MSDKPVTAKAESNSGSGVSWSDVSSSIFSGASLLISPRDAIQGIKDGASAVNKAATAAGGVVEGVIEGGLQSSTAGAAGVLGTAVDAVAGKKAGNAVRAARSAAIDGVGNVADALTQAALGGPQAKVAELAADVALGAMTGGGAAKAAAKAAADAALGTKAGEAAKAAAEAAAGAMAGGAAGKVGQAAMKAAIKAGGDAKPAPKGGELEIPDIFGELKIPKSVQKTGEKVVDEIKQTPTDVYNHLRNNPWRAVPIGLFGGPGALILDAKIAKNK